jgi:hypothetical protein
MNNVRRRTIAPVTIVGDPEGGVNGSLSPSCFTHIVYELALLPKDCALSESTGIVDIGCGDGAFLMHIASWACACDSKRIFMMGIDIQEMLIKYCKEFKKEVKKLSTEVEDKFLDQLHFLKADIAKSCMLPTSFSHAFSFIAGMTEKTIIHVLLLVSEPSCEVKVLVLVDYPISVTTNHLRLLHNCGLLENDKMDDVDLSFQPKCFDVNMKGSNQSMICLIINLTKQKKAKIRRISLELGPQMRQTNLDYNWRRILERQKLKQERIE